jgi:hypothetical protein
MVMTVLQREIFSNRKRRLSLSVRLSLLLVLMAALPLSVVAISSESLARPALVAQSTMALETDARTRIQLIEAYFVERFMDMATLSNASSIQGFLAGKSALKTAALSELTTTLHRDSNYETGALLDLQGHPLLYYPVPPPASALYFLQPANRERLILSEKAGTSLVSFNTTTEEETITVYVPVITGTSKALGILCATLQLNFIWNIVNSEQGANGLGSYAFILDQNGVRIADTESGRLLSSIAPLPMKDRQLVSNETLYGKKIPVFADETLAQIQTSAHAPAIFQMVPYGQHQTFQVVRYPLQYVPWTYFVLSPLSTVTQVADQQVLTSGLIACFALLLAALVGLSVGWYLTGPILRSVAYLRNSSWSLNTLATRQKSVVSEQTWMVASSQLGLQEMQHQTEAIYLVALRLNEMLTSLTRTWDMIDAESAQQILEQITDSVRSIEHAVRRQKMMSKNLTMALRVITQVTEQLTSSAISVTDAAGQLEQVVDQLRLVVGK